MLKLQLCRQHSVARPFSTKLARRFYSPFEVLERIGQVAYRLKVPEGNQVHNVFHVSLLKPFIESAASEAETLPTRFAHGRPVVRPSRLLDRRTVWRNGDAVDEVLLEWDDDGGALPTWEPWLMVRRRFPELLLEDKEAAKGGGVDTIQPSARLKETGTVQPEEEVDFDTRAGSGKEPERSIAKDRSRRRRRPPDHFGDFATRSSEADVPFIVALLMFSICRFLLYFSEQLFNHYLF